MTELLLELVDKWILIFAVLSVGFTEALMRGTPVKVTRWRYAMLSTAGIAILMSFVYSFRQEAVTWRDGIARGIISAIVAIVGYDALKSVAVNLPFIGKKDGNSNI